MSSFLLSVAVLLARIGFRRAGINLGIFVLAHSANRDDPGVRDMRGRLEDARDGRRT